jgi:hypothetical protein
MPDIPTPSLERLGAASGVLAVALLVVLLMVFPAPPAADEEIADIARAVAADELMLRIGDYVGVLMGGAWLLFGIAVAARLRRAEPAGGAWWIVALVGITAATAVGLVGNVLGIMLVRAVGHGLTGDELWTIYSGDLVGFVQGIPLAIFMLGAGLGTRSTGVFPRWTGLVALTAVPLLVVGVGSIAGREVDGGAFVLPLMLAYVGMIVWTLAVCVALWRQHPAVHRTEPAPSPA